MIISCKTCAHGNKFHDYECKLGKTLACLENSESKNPAWIFIYPAPKRENIKFSYVYWRQKTFTITLPEELFEI